MKLLILSLFLVSCGHSKSVEVQVLITKTEREILLVDIDENTEKLSDNVEVHLVEKAKKEALKHKDNKHLKLVRVLTKMLVDSHDQENNEKQEYKQDEKDDNNHENNSVHND